MFPYSCETFGYHFESIKNMGLKHVTLHLLLQYNMKDDVVMQSTNFHQMVLLRNIIFQRLF